MSVTEGLKKIYSTIPQWVKLVAVSKTYAPEAIMEAYQAGQRIFGESKPQELVQKYGQLPKDIEWHFIGHLQTNKIKYIVSFVSLIHSVDSPRLLREINKEAVKSQRKVNCLLQVHIAEEDTKYGFSISELEEFLLSDEFSSANSVNICGLMGMATYTDDLMQIRNEFKKLKQLFVKLKCGTFKDNPEFKELSMGMSGDYTIAIEEGATLVRIGSLIFGNRNYIT